MTFIEVPQIRLPKIHLPTIRIPVITTLQEIIVYLIATLQNRKKYDIILIRTFGRHYLIAGIMAKKIFKKKLIVWIPGSFKTEDRRRVFHRKVIKDSLEYADVICAASEQVVDNVEKNLGKIDRTKLQIISEPIDTSIFKPNQEIATNNNILSVCRLIPLKGIETIIESLPFILNEIPDVKFIHVGPMKDKKYLKKLKDLVTRLNCEKSVEFRGPVPHENLVNVYQSSKIFILTSKTEGQSLVTQEAMGCGIPVIVTPVGAIPDYVEDGINGFHLKNDDPKELAAIIIRLLKDDNLREKIGKDSRKSIEDRSLEENYVNKLTSIFNEISIN